MLVRRSLGNTDDERFLNHAIQLFLDCYGEHSHDHTCVYPGILAALSYLHKGSGGTGRKLAVLSNKPVDLSRQIIAALGLSKYFFQIYGGDSFPN